MKRIIVTSLCCLLVGSLFAQDAKKKPVSPYYRNALAQMMIYHPEDEFGYDVYKIFSNLPELEKFDNHDTNLRVIDNSRVTGVNGNNPGLHRKDGENLELTAAEKRRNALAILKLLNDAQIGKRMVAKWFDLQGNTAQDAYFSTRVLDARSDYNTTIQEAELAKYTSEGVNVRQAISEELIDHTFLLVSDMTYRTAEARAEAASVALGVIGAIVDAATGKNYGERMAQLGTDIANSFTGFKVKTNSYLYQLVWNDSVANVFYSKYYTDKPDPAKMKAFLADKNTFRLIYLGAEDAKAEKTEKIGKYSRTGLLELITRRSIDNNIAKLQSEYEVFRIKTPIVAVEYDTKGKLKGYRALVGMKEGVSETKTYEVLEPKIGSNGKMTYTKIGVLKPINNQIWDNRFNALMENDFDVAVEGTLFKVQGTPSRQIVPGMLIREL